MAIFPNNCQLPRGSYPLNAHPVYSLVGLIAAIIVGGINKINNVLISSINKMNSVPITDVGKINKVDI